MPTPDRIVAALERLDPEDRAHLELSYRRGFSDDEIAGLVGADASEVPGLRDEAVAEMADELEEPEDEVRSTLEGMGEDEWAGRPSRVEEEAAALSEPPTTVSEPRSRRVVLLLVAGAAVLLIALIVALASGGSDDDKGTTTGATQAKKKQKPSKTGTQTQPAQKPPTGGGGGAVALQRLNGTYGHGTAQIVGGNKLRLRVSGFLKPTGGGYAVWLINPPDDARRLFATSRTSINRDLPLPSGFDRYRFVEVARAVPSLSSPHSSFSLLRVRVKALAGGT